MSDDSGKSSGSLLGAEGEQRRIAVVIGAGDALGGSIARRFAREGFEVIASRRTVGKLIELVDGIKKDGGVAHAMPLDATQEREVVELFRKVRAQFGVPEIVVFNSGAFARASILDCELQAFQDMLNANAVAGFLVGREAARALAPAGRGTIIFTGATASVRGAAGFSAFAGSKAALRMLAQSMARELGPKGIHVAHVIVDGVIDTENAKALFPQLFQQLGAEGVLNPEHIASNYWNLHNQPRDAWTHELDVRPFSERW